MSTECPPFFFFTAGLSFLFDTDEVRFGQLIRRPANRSAGRGRDHSRGHPAEKTSKSFSSPDDSRSGEKAVRVSDLEIGGCTSSLKKRFYYIERCGSRGGDTARETAGGAVRKWVVFQFSPPLHDFGERFVGGELERGERDGHGESGGIRDIKCSQAFVAPDGGRAFEEGPGGGAVDLHALLDDIEWVHESIAGDGRAGAAGSCCK